VKTEVSKLNRSKQYPKLYVLWMFSWMPPVGLFVRLPVCDIHLVDRDIRFLRNPVILVLLFFFLWLYSQILGLGRLHETFRFISVTRSRTVSSIPWTGDQLVARTLLTVPGDCDDVEVGGMNGSGRGNRSTRRKPASTPLCPSQIPLARPGREHGPPQWEASD
jgi:hypothetical protein